jgi:hypothetical protein
LIVFIDGVAIYSEDKSRERFEQLVKLREQKDVVGIKKLLLPELTTIVDKVEEEIKEKEKVIVSSDELLNKIFDDVAILVENGDFEIKGDSVYLKGINRSIPKHLVQRFATLAIDEDKTLYEAFKNFWRWIVLNPNARATEEFYKLLENYDMPVSNGGFVFAYRWVAEVPSIVPNKELVEFVSNQWAKIKKFKKSPKSYEVYSKLGDFQVYKFDKVPKDDNDFHKHEGNLDELYKNILNYQPVATYTDGYTGKMQIRIGESVKMDRRDCDESSESCSRGLHACFNLRSYSSHGDVKLLVAICPKDIVSVPYSESKFRCCEYLPVAVLGNDEDEKNFLQKGEGLDLLDDYFQIKLEELKSDAETKTVKELTQNRLLPERFAQMEETIAEVELDEVIDQLQDQLDNRIKPVN